MNKRKTKKELITVRNEIRRYFTIGSTSTEIKQHLNMADRTFNWHMHEIYEEDKTFLKEEQHQLIATEILQTRDRLLRTIRQCELISNNNNTSARDKLEAESLKKETSIDLIRLLRDAPTRFLVEDGSTRENGQADVPRQLPSSRQ